ncbi:MAG: hypothetical protein ABSG84_09745 [Acidobacteriaceae bacterium]|jgi:uncharacterized membrane protein
MQCPACHNEVASESATFCNHCGAPLSAAAPAAAPPPTDAPPAAASSGIDPKLASAIAYLTFIPAVIFLLVAPYNKTPLVRFHSFQSIGLNVVALAISVVLRMVLPFGFFLGLFIQSIVNLGFFIIWIVVVIKAFQGQWFKLPIIGDFAMKQSQG